MSRKPPPRPNRPFKILLTPTQMDGDNCLGTRRCEEFLAAVQGVLPNASAIEMPTLKNRYRACTIQIPTGANKEVIEDFISDPRNFAPFAESVNWAIIPHRLRNQPAYDAEHHQLSLIVSPR